MKTLHEKGIHEPGVLDLRPLIELVRVLREPGGCPWDRVQTHTSMRRELVEEVYEMLEAIDDGDTAGMREEMGMCSSRWCSMPVWQKKKACLPCRT